MIQPRALHPCPLSATWLAWTSHHEGRNCPSVCRNPLVTGNHVPPRKARIETPPPIAGPTESVVTRWPMKIPSAANGSRPIRISAGHHQPAPGRQADSERGARGVEQREAEHRHRIGREHLGAEVGAHGERADPQLARPSRLPLAGDPSAGREHRHHRAERGEPHHVVERHGEAALGEVVVVALRCGQQPVEDQRHAEREQVEAPVAERAQELVARVGDPAHHALAPGGPRVGLARQLEERLLEAPPVISMSRAAGWRPSSARIA